MPFFDYLSADASIADILQRDPSRYQPICDFTQALMRGASPLSLAQRELIAAYVSGLNQCDFCFESHLSVAADLDIDPDLLQRLLSDPHSAGIDAPLLALLLFVRKLTLSPSRMTGRDAESVLDAGWSERALEDAIGICALFSWYNRMVEGHGIKGSAAYFTELPGLVREKGYNGRVRDAAAGGAT